jgi:hypothetical protein
MTPVESVWQEFIADYKGDLDKLFGSSTWKKAIYPWLRANREIKIRTILSSKDHVEIDMARGFVLALEGIMNLPGAVTVTKKEPEQVPQQQDSTDYNDGISWDDTEIN